MMIKLEDDLSGSCLSCGKKLKDALYKITAESESSSLKWSLTLCNHCLEELMYQMGELGKMPRKFKCMNDIGDSSCNTCKHKDIPVAEWSVSYNEICKPCMENKCPMVDVEGSCNGCSWEAM
jgi:hypothetical protein